MSKIISKREFLRNIRRYLNKIKRGAVFIYPTDTIYGIGCISSNKKSIEKIRKIKKRNKKPLSIIAPSKKWIIKNTKSNKNLKKYLKKLPGKYTLILELKNKKTAPNKNLKTIGIRIPKSWTSKIAKKVNQPIITTSVNISNKPHMTSLKNLEKSIKSKIDFIIYEGELNKKPSKVINLITNKKVR